MPGAQGCRPTSPSMHGPDSDRDRTSSSVAVAERLMKLRFPATGGSHRRWWASGYSGLQSHTTLNVTYHRVLFNLLNIIWAKLILYPTITNKTYLLELDSADSSTIKS